MAKTIQVYIMKKEVITRARLKGVKATPTIIMGRDRLTGVPQKEEFEVLLR